MNTKSNNPTKQFKIVGRSQRGAFSLDLGLALLVVLILTIGAVLLYRDHLRKTSVEENTTQLLHISSNMISKYGKPGRYADVTSSIAVRSGVIPTNLRDGTNDTATNLFGGTITVAPDTLTGANDSMLLTWPAVPRNQCSDIVAAVAKEYRRIDVAGATVKPDNGQLDIAAVEDACDGADTLDLALYIGRY